MENSHIRAIDAGNVGFAFASDLDQPEQPLSIGARMVSIIALIAALALILRPLIESAMPELSISDPGIVITAALVLFSLPAPKCNNERLLRWQDAATIRWDVLILFGGGLALAGAIDTSGLARSIGSLFSNLNVLPIAIVILIVMAAIV